mmetsp:Transcript_15043/g.45086  ORF Transcript_15043/g.45086 Transcript_15043/m.45086 type:complete len:201 (-) Transcript_15043:447-1049(-)
MGRTPGQDRSPWWPERSSRPPSARCAALAPSGEDGGSRRSIPASSAPSAWVFASGPEAPGPSWSPGLRMPSRRRTPCGRRTSPWAAWFRPLAASRSSATAWWRSSWPRAGVLGSCATCADRCVSAPPAARQCSRAASRRSSRRSRRCRTQRPSGPMGIAPRGCQMSSRTSSSRSGPTPRWLEIWMSRRASRARSWRSVRL